MSSNLSQIRPWTVEVAALECLKNQFLVLWPLQHLQFISDLQKKKKQKKKTLCPVTVLVGSEVSDRFLMPNYLSDHMSSSDMI